MKKILFVLPVVALASGCATYVGPFVTNVSADGNGNLVVDKNMIRVSAWDGSASLGDRPTTQVIRVTPQPAVAQNPR